MAPLLVDGVDPGEPHFLDVEQGLDLAQHDVVDALLVAQLEERLPSTADESDGEVGVLVVVLDDGVALRTAGRQQLALLVQLVTHSRHHRLAAAELVGRGVESLDGCVEGVLVGELELCGPVSLERVCTQETHLFLIETCLHPPQHDVVDALLVA